MPPTRAKAATAMNSMGFRYQEMPNSLRSSTWAVTVWVASSTTPASTASHRPRRSSQCSSATSSASFPSGRV